MVSRFAAYNFELRAGLCRLLQIKQGYRQREAGAGYERWIQLQGGSELSHRHVVLFRLEGFVASPKVGLDCFLGRRRGLLPKRGLLRKHSRDQPESGKPGEK